MTERLIPNMEKVVTAPSAKDAEVREMLFAVLRSLVDDVDKVELIHVAMAEGIAFQVRCASGDVGKLIGKNGRTARAIRTILSGNAMKNGRKYSLDIAQTTIQ